MSTFIENSYDFMYFRQRMKKIEIFQKSGFRMIKKASRLEWPKKINEIQKQLIMSQADIADYCGVVRQCVSNWKTGYRVPGYHAKRKLVELTAKMDNAYPSPAISPRKGKTSELNSTYSQIMQNNDTETMLKTISNIFKKLDSEQRREVFEFVIFKLERNAVQGEA